MKNLQTFEEFLNESLNEQIKVGDKVIRKFASEDMSTYIVLSISNGKAKLKDEKTGKETGMYLNDLLKESVNEKIEYPEGVKTTDDKILDKLAKLLNSKTGIIEIGTGSVRGKKVPFQNGEAFFDITGYREHWNILCSNGDFEIPRKEIKKAEDLYAQVEKAIQIGEVTIGKKK